MPRRWNVLGCCIFILLAAFGGVYASAQDLHECSKILDSKELQTCMKDAASQIKKERIQAYARATDSVQKWRLAIEYTHDFLVSPMSGSYSDLEQHTGASSGLNDYERAVAKQMFSDLQRIHDLGSQFESSLSNEEISAITRSNPDSLYPKVGRILVWFGARQSECGKTKLDALLSELPETENPRGMLFAVFLHLHIPEATYRVAYAREVVKLLQTKTSYKRYLPGLQLFYKAAESYFEGSRYQAGNQIQIEKSRQRLLSYGVAEPDALDEKVLSLAKRYPTCFTSQLHQLALLPE